MHLDPAAIAPHDRYKLLIGGIVPRPIAWVSTLSHDGRPNLAPFSFFAGVGSNPMTLLFCPANKPDGSEKDTLRNAKPTDEGGTGQFVVCAVPEPLAGHMAVCAEPLPFGQSEAELAGLSTAPSVRVAPPRVAGSPVAFECRTLRVLRTNPGAPDAGNVVLGEVVHVYVDDAAIDPGLRISPAALASVGRMGGQAYCTTRQRFDLPRGRDALASRGQPVV
ncbi:MAG: flavin reductase family protein [Planctomyces sp.]|nr:flavin reductase family protein [Planctomyces sp.]MBA4039540.1 flavin reductase family protein [Planctomyces sp.]MBA4120481.1 flavin reductase family protein [Isosphaera sp.]